MANPNAQLQAAISQFAAQPGITPDQEAQLRAAITQDASLLQHLNQDAANGQLKGFALPQAGTAPNLAGTYDMASGVVTLPATSFQPSGTAPSADLAATLRVQDMSLRFAHTNYVDAANVTQPVTQDMVTNLQSTINGSPVLAAEIKRAVTPPGHGQAAPLQHFASLSGTVAGGTYNPANQTMSLPPSSLAVPPANFKSADLTFVLGHEIQHGFNAQSAQIARNAAYAQARQIAQDNNPVNDYTGSIGAVIQAGREDEAKAQIAGWNALLSREQQRNPAANLTDMMALGLPTNPSQQDLTSRVLDFVQPNLINQQQAQARSGLTFNADGTMSMTTANVAQMGLNYFDKMPKGTQGVPLQQTTGIGFHGDSDYPNYYGAGAVSNVIAYDRAYAHSVNGVAPQMQINMGSLRLQENLMERNGITLPANSFGTPQPYLDTSTNPPKAGLFQQTAATHQHVNPIFAGPLQEQERREKEAKEKEDRYRENGTPDEERSRKADEARDPRNAGKPGMRESDGAQTEPSISLGSPHRDRAYAALKAGDSDEVGRIAMEFTQSSRGQELIERGNQLLAQQQAQELQQLLEQNRQLEQQRESERQRSGPVMTLMQPSPHYHH
ncbi:hypothetical protein [Xanthomonas fragariae]|uniref:hypothetical protein n=1 Tax=Xanthomonas fragariae TaxID=48664 RepID=UPI0022AAA329|nr:hypothetical protein [Xanthomonas fragariae]WAT15067.1 hypothetical protein OZ429_00325 [Xanthomonas fragariae]